MTIQNPETFESGLFGGQISNSLVFKWLGFSYGHSYVTEMAWTGPLAYLSLSSVCKWIRVRVFDPEYCSLPVLYYHEMNVETRVKKVLFLKIQNLTKQIKPQKKCFMWGKQMVETIFKGNTKYFRNGAFRIELCPCIQIYVFWNLDRNCIIVLLLY